MPYMSKQETQSQGVVPIASNLFGTCATAKATAAKVVALADFDVLVSGVTVHVYFTYGNNQSNTTLKVGSTAATAVRRNGLQPLCGKPGQSYRSHITVRIGFRTMLMLE